MSIDEERFRQTEERLRRADARRVPDDPGAKQRWKDAQRRAGDALEAAGRGGEGGLDEGTLERVIGRNDLVDRTFFEAMARASLAVCQVEVDVPVGTGWLLDARLLVTNHHVLRDEGEAALAVVAFNVDAVGATGRRFKLDPARLFVTSPVDALDYTIVAVRQDDEPALREFATTRVAAGYPPGIALGEPLNVIQHPNGEHKQYAVRENEVIAIDERFVHYQTDTNPGSSGSPVYNNRWEVVALHHSGVPRRVDGVIVNRKGEPWKEAEGDHAIDWIANEGVRIDAILRDVAARLGAAARDLFGALLDVPAVAEHHIDLRAAPAAPVTSVAPVADPSAVPPPTPRGDREGVCSFVIPLHVQIRVGDARG